MENLIVASETGFVVHHNVLRAHFAIDDMTQAQAADIDLLLIEGWADFAKIASWNRTGKES